MRNSIKTGSARSIKQKIMRDNQFAESGQLFIRYRDQGDINAFESLMHAFHTPLFNYLLRFLHNREEAEDALQEVWLKSVKQKDAYKEQGQFSSWIYRIAHNHCLDCLRKKGVRTDDNEIVEDEEGFNYLDQIASPGPTPFESLMEKEFSFHLDNEVAQLPALIREVYILRAVHDVPFKEIAEIQKSPLGTVLSRMHQALKRLQPLLEDYTNLKAMESTG